jgi:polysaccharide biosynthesis transport protein
VSAADRLEQARERDGLAKSLTVLRNRWLIVTGVLVVCVLVAVARHETGAKSYAASASVAFQSGTLSDAALQAFHGSTAEPQREADTEVLIAHSPEVARGVIRQLHLSVQPSELLGEARVEAAPNADVLNIIATTGNPRYSARLANAFAEQFIDFRISSELAGIESAEGKLEQQIAALPAGSPERSTLQQSLRRLGELRAVAGGGANIIGLATPPGKPTGLSLTSTVVIGLLIGFALAFTLVLLVESLDRRIKTIEEFEREYRLPVLAGVPRSGFRSSRAADRGELLEPYRILRSALDFAAVTRELDTLLVTSAISGEGKTTVAVDLARAVALAGRSVALVELDLRRPTFAEQFDLKPGGGFSAALTRGVPLADLLIEPFPDLPNLSVLPAGRIPPNPSELLGSPRVADMISKLVSDDGIVIVDATPLNPVADAQVLLNSSAIHSAIIVARLGRTAGNDVRRARAILDRHMVEPVGIVVTGMRDPAGYGYEPYAAPGPPRGGGTKASDAPPGPRRDGDIKPPDAPMSSGSGAAQRLRV